MEADLASHTLLLPPRATAIAPQLYRHASLALQRIDAMALGAIIIAFVMIAALLMLRDDPGSSRGCRSRVFRDPVTGIASGHDGVTPSRDHVTCRANPVRPSRTM